MIDDPFYLIRNTIEDNLEPINSMLDAKPSPRGKYTRATRYDMNNREISPIDLNHLYEAPSEAKIVKKSRFTVRIVTDIKIAGDLYGDSKNIDSKEGNLNDGTE